MQASKLSLLWLLLSMLLWNCQGEEGFPGPAGPPGPPGPAGSPGVGLMYEIVFSLDATNDWQAYFAFPPEDDIFLEDVVLVYLLWDQVETEGDPLDVWRLMPVNYFYDEGILQINYDFSVEDVSIYAEAAFPLDAQKDVFKDFVARIVVVPADFSPNARKSNALDYANYEEVKSAFDLPETERSYGKPFMDMMRASEAQEN